MCSCLTPREAIRGPGGEVSERAPSAASRFYDERGPVDFVEESVTSTTEMGQNIREVCMNGVDLFGLLITGTVVVLWLGGAVDTWWKQRDTSREAASAGWERAA